MTAQEFQLKLPEAEIQRLGNRVLTDYRSDIADHNKRMQRWAQYYRRWRAAAHPGAMAEEGASNVPVPYIRWNVFTKWAKEMDSLFGDDAEIEAVPVGPSDYKKDKKISLYETWRVFNSMKLTNPFCVFVLRKILFGRSVAYSPWKRDTFEVNGQEVVDYEGPDFVTLWPDDFIVPAEEVDSLHEFSHVCRRYKIRPDALLDGEEAGRYQGITRNWERIVNMAQHGAQREEGEDVKREKDEAEGIVYQASQSSGEWVTVIEWYGRWRPLKGRYQSADELDFSRRERRQKEYVVRYLLDANLVIGVQNLADLYPTKRNKRPFVESSMIKDGTYWSPGLAEMLIDLEDELRVNHNQATEAGQLAQQPPIGYRPAGGANPDTFKLEPGMMIPLDNPVTDIRQIEIHANMDLATWKEQCTLAYGEKLTGQGDLQMGRQSDRPNAPRTAHQTQMLLEEGNVRISLDTKVLAEDMSAVLSHFWDLEYMFASPETFFRVTEDDAGGLFPVENGGSVLTLEDRDGRYDFRLKFANSVWSREARKEKTLARYQLDLQNPLIVNNPVALWQVTRDAHEALGDPNFEDLVPKPPQPDISIDPKVEWTMLLEGEEIHVNPMDNDQLHLLRHYKDLQRAQQQQLSGQPVDPDAVKNLTIHYHEQIAQLQQKKLQQAVIEQAMQAAQQIAGGGPGALPGGLFGGTQQTQPPGNPAAAGPAIYSGHPEVMHEQ